MWIFRGDDVITRDCLVSTLAGQKTSLLVNQNNNKEGHRTKEAPFVFGKMDRKPPLIPKTMNKGTHYIKPVGANEAGFDQLKEDAPGLRLRLIGRWENLRKTPLR